MSDKTGVLRTLERSHNTARLTAEESPRSEILAEHSEATRVAIERVTELLAAAEENRNATAEFANDGQPDNWVRYEASESRLDAAIQAIREG